MALTPFHVAIQVRDIAEARRFYGGVLGCAEGRSDRDWVDFNLYGHQLVCHLNPRLGREGRVSSSYNPVDGHGVPVPHCGVVLESAQWRELAALFEDSDNRVFAQECMELARTAKDAGARAVLLHMAQVWVRLAENQTEDSERKDAS